MSLETIISPVARRRPAHLLVALAFIVCTVPLYIYSLSRSQHGPWSFYYPQWASVQFWLSSADCARATGALLAICQGDRIVPIADVTSGDDPGHALTLELYSMLTNQPVLAADVSKINSTINFIGISLLAAVLLRIRLHLVAFVVLVGAPLLANQYHALGPHPANFGIACLSAILPIVVLAFPIDSRPPKGFWVWFGLGICGLAVAMLYREAIGLMGVVAGIIATILRHVVLGPRMSRSLLACIVTACVIASVIAVPKVILETRDVVFKLQPSDMMQQHGAWHNLYIGLGAVDNPFGLMWDDSVGINAVKRIDPSVRYLSNSYYSILKHEYLNIIVHHPWQVFVVYMKKMQVALGSAHIGLVFAIVSVLVAIARRRLSRSFSGWMTADAVLVVTLLFVGMFLAQAVLFHPAIQYLFPIEAFLLVGAGLAAQLLVMVVDAERGTAGAIGSSQPRTAV